jgi:hypothetical protein
MRSTPTTSDTTETTSEEPLEDAIEDTREVFEPTLPHVEKLAGSKVNHSDYPEITPDRERVSEVLWMIEDALWRDDRVRLRMIAEFSDKLQGLDGKGAPVRYALEQVERTIHLVKVCDDDKGKVAVCWLIAKLSTIDPRYGALDPAFVLDLMQEATEHPLTEPAEGKKNRGGLGKGVKGAKWTLAAMMAKCGAHDVPVGDRDKADRRIENARGHTKKPRARPSELRCFRTDGGDKSNREK